MGATIDIADFCTGLKYSDLSSDNIESAKEQALDFIGLAARGSLVDSSRILLSFVKKIKCTGDSIVIGDKTAVAPQYAALLNGAYAHSLDYDDVCNEASLHPGAPIFPAAFAAAEMVKASGADFILSVVIGYEVMCRLGKVLEPSKHYGRGFHSTGTCGVFGAAAAVGRLFGLNSAQMAAAFGICGSQAAGSMEFLTDGTWTKRMHPGWAAHSGLLSAMLAQEGFTGPATIFEGKDGFLNAYSYDTNSDKLVEGLGKDYFISKTSIKPYPCCRYTHGPIYGILKLMKENDLSSEDVDEIIIGMLEVSYSIVIEPAELKYNPQNVVDAQFSMPFAAAVAVLFGKVSADEYSDKVISSDQVKTMMKKVKFIKDSELERLYPRQWPASVIIKTKDGKKYDLFIEYPKGDPENPLTWVELVEKFNDNMKMIFNSQRQDEILTAVKSMDQSKNVEALCELLRGQKE